MRGWLVALALLGGTAQAASWKDWAVFAGGATAALCLHETGHLTLDLAFDAEPEIRGVSFLGVPFFAISPTKPLTPRERFAITSAGFWTQHATSEILLTRDPELRSKRAPFRKGMLAFDVLLSVGYAGSALLHAGPPERDTRGMAEGLDIDERWIGALLLAPAALDTYRYYKPRSKWAKWTSRAVKVGLVALVLVTDKDSDR